MAKKRAGRRVSAGEMEILETLWRQGAATISEAHQALGRKIGYTTVQTRLNRLVDKGLARRSTDRPARYRAAVSQQQVSAGQLDLLLQRVSGGSVVPLVAHLVEDRSLTPKEIAQLRRLIDEAEKNLPSK
ncbi:MAG TPA: BlaI/MecI/CopY family transcriptional regulator [Thermoguttaceae bacterium]|nr:BlaI/MecI/CopY family transcriptional regulator [Thermoguttaceae bacterium]